MNNRTKTLWLPALACLTGSMLCRFILQRSFPPSQPLLNHAGLPLAYQLIWLAALPSFGALSVYLSRRAGGDPLTGLMAALSGVTIQRGIKMIEGARVWEKKGGKKLKGP